MVAKQLVGKILVRRFNNGELKRLRITQTEAYCGEEDKACHASHGRTKRTEVLYHKAGTIYVYLCYGMHNLLNIVTGEIDKPEAVLIRCCEDFEGPAKLTKELCIDRSFNDISIINNENIWIEDDGYFPDIVTDKRVGIAYAGEEWINKPWRFINRK